MIQQGNQEYATLWVNDPILEIMSRKPKIFKCILKTVLPCQANIPLVVSFTFILLDVIKTTLLEMSHAN